MERRYVTVREIRPLGFGDQEPIPNHHKLLS